MSVATYFRHQLVILSVAAFSAAGCALVGPTSIRKGRAAYNEAILVTNSQQILAMIVRMRYGEPSSLLGVSSVTANLQMRTNVGAEFGIGSDSSFEGNLVPLSAGVGYEENPTISYAPVQGEKYLRQMLSPLPVDLAVLLLESVGNSPYAMTLLCRSINGIRNPDFLTDPSVRPDPRFARVVELLVALHRSGQAGWQQESHERGSYVLALNGAGPSYRQQVVDLYELLGFPPPQDLSQVIELPLELGLGRPSSPGIRLRTRSLWALFSIAAATVEVPEEHLQSGLAAPLPPLGPVGRSIRIHGSKGRPRGAMIGFKHHGWWYSIDATDASSKLTFRVLEALMSVRIAEASRHKGEPVLTVPVSR